MPGYYFVTVCANKRELLFGSVTKERIELSKFGSIVEKRWKEIPAHFPSVVLDEFVLMPNHFHGIVLLGRRGGVSPPSFDFVPTPEEGAMTAPLRLAPKLGQVIAYFKYQSTRAINELRVTPGVPLWQRNYYERIIRDDQELMDTRNYIRLNPHHWRDDEYFA